MRTTNDIVFEDFRLDLANECLWQGSRTISLRPKAFAVLKLLIEHPGQLVNKQQVLDKVWPNTFVGDTVLKDNIRQLRKALEDDADAPRYIETAHRRGYRFIAKLSGPVPSVVESAPAPVAQLSSRSEQLVGPSTACEVLGRDMEMATMRLWLERALQGTRQTVFVTGEPGIGKTTVVQAFLQFASHFARVRVVRGQCLEHYGSGEAYLPILDGFSRLCRSTDGAPVLDVLRQHAPAWVAQMPSLSPPSETDSLKARVANPTRERMLREMAEAIETLSAEHPLVLVLEDLHWSDFSTLDLVSYLARRRDPARLMVIGTYRPVDVILGDHPLKGVKRELQAHGLCHELPLEYLNQEVVAQYLASRFPGDQLPGRFARAIYKRTEGNPLFMLNLVEYLIDRKMVIQEQGAWRLSVEVSEIEHEVPASLRELIEKQIERLTPDERTVLEGASVVGMECSSAAIAAGLERPTEWVEAKCEELARRHRFLSPAWLVQLPDGTITPRHRFNHILYLEVPYRLIPPMRRSQIHYRIAERGVVIYGDRDTEIAAELAMHFEQSRDWSAAVKYLLRAAENATARSAHHEGTDLARRGLEVLKSLPDSPDRVRQEIQLRMVLGSSLMAIKGYASEEVEEVYAPSRQLFWLHGPSPELFHMLWSLNLYYQFTGAVQSSLEVSLQLLQLATDLNDGALIMEAHRSIGAALVILNRCDEALTHLNEAVALYAAHRNHRHAMFMGRDCKVICHSFIARALWALGRPDESAQIMAGALALARELGHPQTLVVAGYCAAQMHQLRGDALSTYQCAKESIELADEYGLEFWLPLGVILAGWADAELGNAQSGIEQMQRGLATYESSGAKLWSPYFLGLLGDQLAKAGYLEKAREIISKGVAIAEQTGEGYSLPELRRLESTLLVRLIS
jgi:DNA-binding winged helix-turn-helix (wHTH) protein/tetratricopeptide (TPR) repeat protein/Cdc6-like AAA superfamily ATPase